MFFQVTQEEFLREISKKAWYRTNNIIFSIIFLYWLIGIIDFIYLPNLWVQFTIVRLITIIIIYGLYNVFLKNNYDYRILLHISLLMLSIASALLCNIVDLQHLNIYFLVYSAIILFFNTLVFLGGHQTPLCNRWWR